MLIPFFLTFVLNEGRGSNTWTFLGSRRLLLSLPLVLFVLFLRCVCGQLRPGLRLFITNAWMIG